MGIEVDNEKNKAQNPVKSGQALPVTTTGTGGQKKLSLIPLIFLIYFEVSGGPYGEEPAVQAAGPLYAIMGFLVFPFIWSVPEALITAELGTAYPGDGGFVIWAERAFGPFWGSIMATWKFLSGVINTACFPVVCIDYLQRWFPMFESGLPRGLAILVTTLGLSFLNYTLGLTVVGYASVALGVVSLLPFVVMSLVAIPQIHPHRWLRHSHGVNKDWNLLLNTLFWNLNFWDNVSTLAGEVDRPEKTFPMGLFSAVILTCLANLIPLLAVTGSVNVSVEDRGSWETGFMADAAEMIVGKWLKIWIEIGAVLSAIGLFEAQLSSCAFQVLGMANIGFLPRFFAARSKGFNSSPWVGILASTIVTLGFSYMTFTDIISSANFLYSSGMLLEFASFLWLRRTRPEPELKRPYRVPMGLPGLVIMCMVPSVFLVMATKTVFLLSALMTAVGIAWFFLMKLCKSKKWCAFSSNQVEER